MPASNCEPVARNTLMPESAARAAATPSSEVFPTPGSPDSSSASPAPVAIWLQEPSQLLDLRLTAGQLRPRAATRSRDVTLKSIYRPSPCPPAPV